MLIAFDWISPADMQSGDIQSFFSPIGDFLGAREYYKLRMLLLLHHLLQDDSHHALPESLKIEDINFLQIMAAQASIQI